MRCPICRTCYFLLNVVPSNTLSIDKQRLATNLLFSFEFCLSEASSGAGVYQAVLLFSFEFCCPKTEKRSKEADILETCYFLLNFVDNSREWEMEEHFCFLLFSFEFCFVERLCSLYRAACYVYSFCLAIFFWILYPLSHGLYGGVACLNLLFSFECCLEAHHGELRETRDRLLAIFLLNVVLWQYWNHRGWRHHGLAIFFWMLCQTV